MAAIHLLVLVHGMWGNPNHLAELARIIRETHDTQSSDGTSLHVLLAETVKDDSTYDGVDWGGERVAKEVVETVKELRTRGDHVTRFSITGYSLGGLISRYCIGVLHQQGFFDTVEPVNFNTIATPHCGLPEYRTFFSGLTHKLGPRLLSRTGEQFYCQDKWSPQGRPLLVVMADPDRIFYQALEKFKQIRIYANAVNDMTVPYITAAIETKDPFADFEATGLQVTSLEKYAAVVESYSFPPVPPPKAPRPTALTPAWFRSLAPSRPILPPFLQLRFPLNLVLYLMLPILIPTFISIALVRFKLASRSSRRRIKLLENESPHDGRQRLVDILAEIEREMEEAVVDLIDNPNPNGSIYQPEDLSHAHPIVTPNHRKIAAWLNTLPIKKELAYFPNIRNSHAMIICRDVKRFEAHRNGESVVRHWADAFVL